MRPKSNGLPPLCLYIGQGADLLQDPPVFVCGGLRPSGPPRKQLFLHLPQRGPVHPVDPARRRTPPPSPLGEAWGSCLFRRGAYHAPDTLHGEKPASRRPASIAISYFRHRFKVGSQAAGASSCLLLGAEGMSVLLIKFQVKGDHVLHCGLRRGECAPSDSTSGSNPGWGFRRRCSPCPRGASRGMPQHWQKIRSSISGSSFCSGGCSLLCALRIRLDT